MKKELLKGIALLTMSGLFMFTTSCNSVSKSKTGDKGAFNQEAFNEQIQGVWQYLSPNQGYSAAYNNKFIFIFGDSDSTMVCQAGTYTTSGDTVIYTTQYASNPELIGSVIRWSPRFTGNDIFKFVLFDDKGNITNEISNSWKAHVDETTISNLREFEGSYNYLPPGVGAGILLSGYFLYVGGSVNAAGGDVFTYSYRNDTVTCKSIFSTHPETSMTDLRFISESMSGDTLSWASINDKGEIRSRGKSLYSR